MIKSSKFHKRLMRLSAAMIFALLGFILSADISLAIKSESINYLNEYIKMTGGSDIWAPDLSPQKDRVIYTTEEGGLYFKEISTGKTKEIFKKESLKPWGVKWSPDGTKIAFLLGKDYNDQENDVIVKNLKTGKEITISKATAFDWANNSEDILFLENFDDELKTQSLLVFNIKSNSKKNLYQFKGVYVRTIAWSPDGEKVAFWGNIEGFTGIFVLNLKTNKYFKIAKGDWGVDLFRWLKDSRRIVWYYCQSMTCVLAIEDVVDKKTIAYYGDAEFIDLSAKEDKIYYKRSTPADWGVFVNTIPPGKEVQIYGDPITTQENLGDRILNRIKNFSSLEINKRREMADSLFAILNPPVGRPIGLRNKKAIETIGELTLAEKDPETKRLLIFTLEGVLRYGAESYAIPYLVKMAGDKTLNSETRAQCAGVLLWSHGESTIPYLLKFIKDEDKIVRKAAYQALYEQSLKNKDDRILSFVIDAAKNEHDPEIKNEAKKLLEIYKNIKEP